MPENVLKTYSINELSREFHVTPRTLRHYEEQGLITPRRNGQTRVYNAKDRARLAWILRGKRVGFSLQEIGQMLDLYDLDDGREKQRTVTIERCQDRIRALEAQRDDINATIYELQEFCDTLANLKRCRKTGQWLRKDTGEPVTGYALLAAGQ